MKKARKLFALLIALVMSISQSAALAQYMPGGSFTVANCSHSWIADPIGEPTCTESASIYYYCPKCEAEREEIVPALGHKYSWTETRSATCTQAGQENGTCSRCGNETTRSTGYAPHDYEWNVVRESTCTKAGEKHGVCKDCSHNTTAAIGLAKHDFEWNVTKEPTCIERGEREGACRVCGVPTKQQLEKIDHPYGEWVVITEAQGTTMGERVRTCAICGKEEREIVYPSDALYKGVEGRDEEVKALQQALVDEGYMSGPVDGDFGRQTEAAVQAFAKDRGLESSGVAWGEVISALNHIFGPWEYESSATGMEKVLRRRSCEVCGYVEEEYSWPQGTLYPDVEGLEDEVKALQQALNEQGYLNSRIDGDYGKITTEAVRDFQLANGLNADGIAWPAVQELLFDVKPDDFEPGIGAGSEEAIVSVRFELISTLPASLAPGQSAKVAYRATNDGTAVLKCSWFGIDCGAERAQKDYGKLNGGDRYWFLPGDSFTFEQQINVSDQDIANGSVKRTLLVSGEIWVSKENGEIIVMANQAEMNNYASRTLSGRWSVSEGYEIPLVDEAPEQDVEAELVSADGLELTLALSSSPANGTHFVVGEDVVFTESWANNTDKTLYPFSVSIFTCAAPAYGSEVDQICSWFAEDAGGPVAPGASGGHTLTVTVTEADVARGGIHAMAELLSTVQDGLDLENVATPFVTAPCGPEKSGDIGLVDGLTVIKKVTSTPANGSFFTLGETIDYAITIANGTNREMRNVIVTDLLTNGSGSLETTLFETAVWEKDASQTLSYSYTVTAEDVALGYVTNSALIHAVNNIGLHWESVSEDVTVPVGGGREVLFETRVISTPEVMPGFYVPGETIYYEAVITNNSNAALLNAEVETSLVPGVSLISSDRIEAGETLVCGPYTYQATFDDAVGPLVNTSQLTFTYEDTQASDARSSSAEVWIGLNDGTLEITKSIANAPANGSFFTEGETIEYVITCTNATNEAMFDIVVTDMLTSGSGYSETILSESPAWAKGVSANTGFSHTVTAEDVALGYVTNSALIHAVNNIGLHWETESEPVTALTGVAQTPAVPGSSEEIQPDTVPETPADPKAPAAEQKPAASIGAEAAVPLWLTIPGTPVDGMVDRSSFATSASLYQAQLSGEADTGMVLSAASDEALGNQIIYIADLEDSGIFSAIASLFNFDADPSQNTALFGPKNAQATYQIAALMRMNVSDEPFNLTNMTDLTNRAVYKVYQTALSMAPVRLQNVEVAYGDDMLTLVVWDQVHHGQCLVVVAKKQ